MKMYLKYANYAWHCISWRNVDTRENDSFEDQ